MKSYICPTCNRTFYINKESVQAEIILENDIEDAKANYLYCSQKCFDAKLDTLGIGVAIHERVIITKKEKLSDNFYRIYCKQLLLKTETN